MADRSGYPARHIGPERATGCRDPRQHHTQAPHQHRTAAGQPDREANLPRRPNPNIGEQYPFPQEGFRGARDRCQASPPSGRLRRLFKHTRRHEANPGPTNRDGSRRSAARRESGRSACYPPSARTRSPYSRLAPLLQGNRRTYRGRGAQTSATPHVGAPQGAKAAVPHAPTVGKNPIALFADSRPAPINDAAPPAPPRGPCPAP